MFKFENCLIILATLHLHKELWLQKMTFVMLNLAILC